MGPSRTWWSTATLRQRFPRLATLEAQHGRIPYVQQTALADCGAAALAMALGFHGTRLTLDELRPACGTGRDGTMATTLAAVARSFGFTARVLRVGTRDLRLLPRATILHWKFSHYVVLDRVRDKDVVIRDPAGGKKIVSNDLLDRLFTGVAIVITPGVGHVRADRTRSGRYARYLSLVGSQRHHMLRFAGASLGLRVLGLFSPLLTGVLVDRVVARADYSLFLVLMIAACGVLLFQIATIALRAHIGLAMRTHLEAASTIGLIDHISQLPYAYFEQRTTGDLITRMNSLARVRDILTNTVLSGLLDGTLAVLYFALLLIGSPDLCMTAIGLALCRLTIMAIVRQRTRALANEALETQSRVMQQQVEFLGGMETLRSSGSEDVAAERWCNSYIDGLNVAIRSGRLSAITESVMSAVDYATPFVILSVGVTEVLDGSLTLGQMLALNTLAMAALGPLGSLVGSLTQLQLLGTHLDRVEDVVNADPEQVNSASTKVRVKGGLDLVAIDFKYTSSSPLVLANIDLHVEPGQCVAIVGRSGSGKSTLGRIILGLYPPTSGKVYMDGVELSNIDLRDMRKQLGVVVQNTPLFTGTIRTNIAGPRRECDTQDIVLAAKRADIHDEIMAMPMGYETLLSNGGSSLSGGQRQRIALARALVHNPRLLLLDEATSSLDQETEARIRRAIDGLQCTRIVIAHRLSTVMNADRIVVLEGGRIVETGTHADLLAREGRYAQLVASQGQPVMASTR